MKYELWSVRSDNRPALVSQHDSLFWASCALARSVASVSTAEFWLVRPELFSQENPEGLDSDDAEAVSAVYAWARRRKVLRGAKPLAIKCKARDLSETLRLSIGVLQGRYQLGKPPRQAILESVHSQLDWAARFPNILSEIR